MESILAGCLASDLSEYVDLANENDTDQFLSQFLTNFKDDGADGIQGHESWKTWLKDDQESSGEDKSIPPPNGIVLKEAPEYSE